MYIIVLPELKCECSEEREIRTSFLIQPPWAVFKSITLVPEKKEVLGQHVGNKIVFAEYTDCSFSESSRELLK